jgi:raffinose/stachyose/melibiose transport system permease protein
MNDEFAVATKNKVKNGLLIAFLSLLSIVYIAPIILILLNSFKDRLHISASFFSLPDRESFAGFENFTTGIFGINFFHAFGLSLYITITSVLVILFFTAMTSWYITRMNSMFSKIFFYALMLSMVVPFQMVMYPMVNVANTLHIDNIYGVIFIYLGFGAGLSTFMYSGFIKSIPLEIEEAAMIDGCKPLQIFFLVVLPMLKPIIITIAILNTMWVWNDYLLPALVIGLDNKTIPMAVQYLQGGYSQMDMGALMAMLILSIVPIIIFYLTCQKYIIEGAIAGAVKG